MPHSPKARVEVSPEAVRALLKELEDFFDKFDTSSPDTMRLSLDEHISTLLNNGLLSDRSAAPDLEDVLANILHGHVSEDLLLSAEAMRRLLESYQDIPSLDDMEEAYSLLEDMIGGIREIAQKVERR